ncbi:PD-(D/E)XK nuclease family protein [Undibacterium sp. LX40W]|uniref:PD-(D/E)XK nuclease family protein n=1 Tax=Undibacterium nitidum TaxID=2762298 RepID=A0A923HL76_9BURK|nr:MULTISPECIES: PD-(D/E)XK nuclease family protein [Undibacterium]MBC3880408.1 PD-(D/E)XK nuclease family protein [Undibacterium nitidum]MBC3890855.1 PD-(D/E)XK nuclease family protein [Undibacterium sp. LX40W]
MTRTLQLIPVSASFWQQVASAFLEKANKNAIAQATAKRMQADLFAPADESTTNSRIVHDYAHLRVVVPTFEHAQVFLKALQQAIGTHFIPPRILTMFAWTGQQAPLAVNVSGDSQRLMSLYGELRQHEWLKKLFGARSNTDLLPLAQTLLNLSDELTQVWLPKVLDANGTISPEKMVDTWQQALAQLPLPVQKMVSDESQLVWTLWQGQLDQHDHNVQLLQKMLVIAAQAEEELFWISPTMPNAMEEAFLQAYKRTVHVMSIDWNAKALPRQVLSAWPRITGEPTDEKLSSRSTDSNSVSPEFCWSRLRLCDAASLEDEAVQAAQTIIEWLQAGKQEIAVIAQDRVVSRRLRALLERAGVFVADETGWKLSTTRAAAGVASWFDVVATRADSLVLLDFLKSPFLSVFESDLIATDGKVLAEADKADLVMEIELVLRRHNVVGAWDAVLSALETHPAARQWIAKIARLAHSYGASASASRRNLKDWTSLSLQTFEELGLLGNLQSDIAGAQLIQMLQALASECESITLQFNFSEWRAFIQLQMENTAFKFSHHDQRVLMLPLNGARLRRFDAVYLIGGDARHLPSKPQETLFFTNAVRRECGLVSREERQLQQLRDFAEVLLTNDEVVLSWQSQNNGELNAVSPWIEQINLDLARRGEPQLHLKKQELTARHLSYTPVAQPLPTAAELLPQTLSASGLSSLIACPYQFFASRMLKLAALDELNDMPEKRDYGDWLHAILKNYHDHLTQHQIALQADRVSILRDISATWFKRVLKHSPAALGYSMRWEKVIPAYVDWANQREADGWQYIFGEVWAEQKLSWGEGEILLRGRLDRIDQRLLDNGDQELAVLDYKTKNKRSLDKRVKSFEDHQLAFYGLLLPVIPSENKNDEKQYLDPVDTANYVALELEKDKTGDVEAGNYQQWKNELKKTIETNMHAIQRGHALPANGVESACQYCEMRGLCRKGAW